MENNICKNSILNIFVNKISSFFIWQSFLIFNFTFLILYISVINWVKLRFNFGDHFVIKVSIWEIIQIDAVISWGQLLKIFLPISINLISKLLYRVSGPLKYLIILFHLFVKLTQNVGCVWSSWDSTLARLHWLSKRLIHFKI